ncbi:MAG TPA: hypothetical protein V6C65_22655 [Allocoleopsis sp.]
MDVLVDEFFQDQKIDGKQAVVPGFLVRSTAPINIEDDERTTDETLPTIYDVVEYLYQNRKANPSYIGLIIQIHGYNTGVKTVSCDGKIRGRDYDYQTNLQARKKCGVIDYIYKNWKDSWQYINQTDQAIKTKENCFVYLGYRWPSESVPSNLGAAVKALPFLLKILFGFGLGITVLGWVLITLYASAAFDALLAVLIAIGVGLVMLVGSLFILRVIVYFRDNYRANNFGVPDLVEFIRQLDQGVLKRTINEPFFNQVYAELVRQDISVNLDIQSVDSPLLLKAIRKVWEQSESTPELFKRCDVIQFRQIIPRLQQRELGQVNDAIFLQIYQTWFKIELPKYSLDEYAEAQKFWEEPEKRIRLTFIGHSMGAFVTTQAVRILSDVFDPTSIGSVDALGKLPPSNIGRVFSLGRLILVSPDIPVKTIASGRTNFLRASLRRFEEAYLFSNEGDLALRLASTAANYFSFPASTRTQGYRLGNVTVNLQDKNAYGIVNLKKLLEENNDDLLQYIGIKVFNRKDRSLEPRNNVRNDPESIAATQTDPESLADLFTYFDCTEYHDLTSYEGRTQQPMNVMICNKQRSPLKLWNYIRLLKAYIDFSKNPKTGIDVHGGYFYGQLSRSLIYRLAFLGFQGLLDTLIAELRSGNIPRDLSPDLMEKVNTLETLNQHDQRLLALKYLSWQCKDKRMQVAASPERYLVDIAGRDRNQIRTRMLTQKTNPAGTPPTDSAPISVEPSDHC